MLAEMNTGISSAYQRLQVISQDDMMRQEYEARMKAVRDQNQYVIEAEERGIEKGIETGQKILIESMLHSMSIEEIARLTKMPLSHIKQIIER